MGSSTSRISAPCHSRLPRCDRSAFVQHLNADNAVFPDQGFSDPPCRRRPSADTAGPLYRRKPQLRSCASRRSNLKSFGKRPRYLRRRGLLRHLEHPVPGDMNLYVPPSFRSSASTTDAGRRTAKLLPHFETCMRFATRYTFSSLYIIHGKHYCSLIQEPLQDVA